MLTKNILTNRIFLNKIESKKQKEIYMPKTITIRLENQIYNMFKKAADGERRSISNFIEYATLTYLLDEIYVSDKEMEEIKPLIPSLKKGLKNIKDGKYTIVK